MTRTLWDKLPYACGRKEERYGKDLRFLPIEKKQSLQVVLKGM